MLNAAERALVTALRSGRFKQGKSRLMESGGYYCCLGVACRISNLGRFIKSTRGYKYKVSNIDLDNAYLPAQVQLWLGWRDNCGLLTKHGAETTGYPNLIAANDHGVPFSTIADWIEKGYIAKSDSNS